MNNLTEGRNNTFKEGWRVSHGRLNFIRGPCLMRPCGGNPDRD